MGVRVRVGEGVGVLTPAWDLRVVVLPVLGCLTVRCLCALGLGGSGSRSGLRLEWVGLWSVDQVGPVASVTQLLAMVATVPPHKTVATSLPLGLVDLHIFV